jgi:DNA-binding LacI/PurR family transcriptional regulator
MSKPTIDDVARRAGYSKATVSAVLNDLDTVRESTREKIKAVMEELNYRPRTSARNGFKPGSARTLGLIIKEVNNPYYAEIIAGARAYAYDKGYTVLTASSEGDYEAEKDIVEVLKAKDVDGLIVIPLIGAKTDLSYLFDLMRRNFPFVLLEEIWGVQASVIDVNNVDASKKAVQYLIEQGHTRIVHFAGPEYSMHTRERIEGLRRAYSESHLIFDDQMIVPGGAYLEDGYRQGLEFIRQNRERLPTAITCYNDLVALGLMRALAELGVRVPDEVSVIGYDDIDILDYLPLPLTTMRVPKSEMGRRAAEMLIEHIESNKKLPPRKIYLEAELVIRKSTRAIAQQRAEQKMPST